MSTPADPGACTIETHAGPPSALRFMARAFLPSRGFRADEGVPRIVQRWPALRIGGEHLARFRAATGSADDTQVPVLYPHVLGFRLQMTTLTHRAFPLPIWGALQIRNQLVQHRPLVEGEVLDLETRTAGWRVVGKGVEIDLHSRLSSRDECAWESCITYFYRGRFGAPSGVAAAVAAPAVRGAEPVAAFEMPGAGGWDFGALTGDYNGIHWSRPYARRFGFESAFLHPQRTAGLCLARLCGLGGAAQRLDLWIKGPVFYGAKVCLVAVQAEGQADFALSVAGDSRMALVGSWRAA